MGNAKEIGKNLAALVKKYEGWFDENEDGIIRFPTPHQKDQFLKEWEAR